MKIIIPFFHTDQKIPQQYTRLLSGKMSCLYLIETVVNTKTDLQVEVWTDIHKVHLKLQDYENVTSRLTSRFFEEKKISPDIGDEEAFIINAHLLLLSSETICKLTKNPEFTPIVYKAHNEWIVFCGAVSLYFEKDWIERIKQKDVSIPKIDTTNLSSKVGWWIAEKEIRKKKIVIHTKSSSKIGMGHVYRGVTLATKLALEHEILFVFQEDQKIGIDLVTREGYSVKTYLDSAIPIIEEFQADVVINDLLNTTKEYMLELRRLGCRIVNFEDLGEGAELADAVINALYPGDVPRKNFYTGQKYYCIREDFIGVAKKEVKESVQEILITFGGADPQNLTLKTIQGLLPIQKKYKFRIRVILGPAYQKHQELYQFLEREQGQYPVYVHEVVTEMAQFMKEADIIFTSAGRTMFEIATIGTPAIVIAQNYRELTHTFGHPYNGFYDLGYWAELKVEDYGNAAETLINDYELRKLMNSRMKKIDLTMGIERVTKIILGEGAFDE